MTYRFRPDPRHEWLLAAAAAGSALPALLIAGWAQQRGALDRLLEQFAFWAVVLGGPALGAFFFYWIRRQRRDARLQLDERGLRIAMAGQVRREVRWRDVKRVRRRRGMLLLESDANWGRTLLAEKVSQGHPADWPAYRLEWQTLGSLQRRLRACYFGVRAALPAFGAPELVALELYLAQRARGLAVAAPGVRR